MAFETVFFDFHGVLCRDYLFSGLHDDYPHVEEYIENELFGKYNDLIQEWMRGRKTVEDVNLHISRKTGIDPQLLSEYLKRSITQMNIDQRILGAAKNLVDRNKKVALVTDNMDIFSTITVKEHGLDRVFPVIVNSSDHGMLKQDCEGRLFDVAMEMLGDVDLEKTLLIDDSLGVRNVFERKGGAVFTYETYEKFEPWMREKLPQAFLSRADSF